ncbi:SUC2 [Symbiodinium pilosum]|uniref:SUC2 protein n=1 Tax=Symbiodinium pilosum TaxID=2952 RepID=A0A812TDR1_SYMPI|nr:SUC2 [Symbiodinium pilosum]
MAQIANNGAEELIADKRATDNDEEAAFCLDKGLKAGEESADAEEKEFYPLWKLTLIAIPQLGVQVMWCFIGPNAAPYMGHLGVGPSLATLNNIAGPITGFFTGPIIGAVSDRLTSKWGRRRPIILGGLISTWIAAMLFSSSEHLFSSTTAKIGFAVPMYWVMDVTMNVLQTPHRALVSDLATVEQQVPMQVVFVVIMSIGNFLGYSIMQIYDIPVEHMFTLMLMICTLNTICIAIQFSVAKEVPLKKSDTDESGGCCAPVLSVFSSIRGMPCLLYHLAFVQCLVWIGNTAWQYYSEQWFAIAVYGGDQHAPAGSEEKINYGRGVQAFSQGGQMRSGFQLLAALAIIALLLGTRLRPRMIYAPCIYVGAIVSFLAGYVVGTNAAFAVGVFVTSIMPETGSFAIPFGLVATLNKRAEQEGKQVSTALQMALLNCCVTVGQQVCHMVLAIIEHQLPLKAALPCVFLFAAVSYTLGGSSALCLDDAPPGEEPSEYSSTEESDSA